MAHRLLGCLGKAKVSTHASIARNTAVEFLADDQNNDGLVLVELFSSQGCALSSEAELLVSRLGRGDFELEMPVMVLVFHVDYWDYVGWKDPFGSSQWTVRQKAYVEALELDTMFTPQVVIQGRSQCVGNDEEALLNSIKQAPRFPAPAFQVVFGRPSPESLQVSLKGPLRIKMDKEGANILVALFESGLVTDCPAGENKGRVLSNDYVVRKLEKLCTVKDASPKKVLSGTLHFPLWEGFTARKCGVVVFLQNSSHHIFGSQIFKLPGDI